MKKLLLALIAAATAVTFAACGSSAPVKDAVNDATSTTIENMTAEAAAGAYTLRAVKNTNKETKLSLASFDTNALTLQSDGTFLLTVAAAGEEPIECKGTFDVTASGALTFNGENETGVYLIAKGEKTLCDGERITVSGLLGNDTVTMEYTKDGVESLLSDKTESTDDKTASDVSDDNVADDNAQKADTADNGEAADNTENTDNAENTENTEENTENTEDLDKPEK